MEEEGKTMRREVWVEPSTSLSSSCHTTIHLMGRAAEGGVVLVAVKTSVEVAPPTGEWLGNIPGYSNFTIPLLPTTPDDRSSRSLLPTIPDSPALVLS